MALLKTITTPNGVLTTYHKVDAVEGKFPDLTILVRSWIDRDACLAGKPAMWTHYLPFSGSSLESIFEEAAAAGGDLEGATIVDTTDDSLGAAKLRKWAAIKSHRDALMVAPLPFEDFEVDADTSSVIKFMGAVMAMQLRDAETKMWRCADNVMRELTLAQIIAIGLAIEARTQALVDKSALVYDEIMAATTVEQLGEISWPPA